MTGSRTTTKSTDPTGIINEIRSYVDTWRHLPSPGQWLVTPETARLLHYWRHHPFQGIRPFCCQVEAVETAIWLAEVAPKMGRRMAKFWEHLKGANEQANPELLRVALKLATGAGKTMVMAMLLAWQTVNAVRHPGSRQFSRGFLVVTPGITIRDRLRVLQPNDPDSYYQSRELVPSDMLGDIHRAKIVITNYHAFKRRERLDVSRVGRALRKGRGPDLDTGETEGQMLQRVMPDLMGLKSLVVLNDEAHHCYYDLSATPFFLRGSGDAEGTLFPWTVSDFSLMDAIECGIVKLPRVPVADNIPGGEMPKFRNLWDHPGKRMPRTGRGKTAKGLDPLSLLAELQTALEALYGHYTRTYDLLGGRWHWCASRVHRGVQ